MKCKTILFSLLACLMASSPAWALEMLATRPSPKKYTRIAQLEATKKSPEKAYEELRKSAERMGADAVVGIRCTRQANESAEANGNDRASDMGDRLNQAGKKTKLLSGDINSTSDKLGGTAGKVGQVGKTAAGIGSAVQTTSSIISIFKSNKPKTVCTGEAVQWLSAKR